MSGHSKWATIKRKKAAIDSKRGKIFTKLLREIQVAARLGGGSVEGNPRLKVAVLAAKSVSVPNDNIDRAIKRGAGGLDGENYEEIVYEGYGPGGVAILVRALTDNKNRTASEVRHAFAKGGGSLGSTNSVAYLFSEKGCFMVPKELSTEEQLFEIALNAGAEDIKDEGDSWEILTPTQSYDQVRAVLAKLGDGISGEVKLVPATIVSVSGQEAQSLLELLDLLDDLDDVQNVSANFDIDASVMEGK